MRAGGAVASDFYEIEALTLDHDRIRLEQYRGRVLLIVNVASRCGFTPQYAGLERLYRKHRDAGFVVLGFPCNQFGQQEPGTADDIRTFCKDKYDISFPLFDRVDVNGPAAHPLFSFLKAQKPGLLGFGAIKWNFTKFLVDRAGHVVERFSPAETPGSIEPRIVRLLTGSP
jgi:glutathione peroxidase